MQRPRIITPYVPRSLLATSHFPRIEGREGIKTSFRLQERWRPITSSSLSDHHRRIHYYICSHQCLRYLLIILGLFMACSALPMHSQSLLQPPSRAVTREAKFEKRTDY
jgi:hypothetical protein